MVAETLVRLRISEEHLRIFTYVLLGMLLGVVVVALLIDFHTSSRERVQEPPASRETPKGDSPDESDSTGA